MGRVDFIDQKKNAFSVKCQSGDIFIACYSAFFSQRPLPVWGDPVMAYRDDPSCRSVAWFVL